MLFLTVNICPSVNETCLNGGHCTPLDNSTYTCHCVDGFYGEYCELGKIYLQV